MSKAVRAFLLMLALGCADGSASPDAAVGGGDGDASCLEGCGPGAPDASTTPTWALADVFGVPNLDDDDGAGRDWDQPPFPADDDLSHLVLPAANLDQLGPGEELVVALTGDTDAIRVYHGLELVLGAGAPGTSYRLTPPGGDVELTIEFGDYLVAGTLSVEHVDAAGMRVSGAEVALRSSPLIMNHHLQPAEQVWAVRVTEQGYDNRALIDAYQAILGERFTSVHGPAYDWDVWIQDEIELATITGAQGQRLDVVIDSIRNRGLAGYVPQLMEPGTIAQRWGVLSQATTFDSFGNLEASPPVTVGGVDYPFGRIYYGKEGNVGLHAHLASFLASQRVQAPFELPTRWLCVGHVDEFSTFIPDPSSPKGFKLLLADVPSALQILAGLPGGTSLPRYSSGHGYSTVGAIRNHGALIALNNAIQADYLDPIRQRFEQELGLTADDIILVPSLFERVPGCDGTVGALIPGMVNLFVADVGETTHLFVPDPFFRASAGDQSADPIIAAFRARMPAGIALHFVDAWNVYHLGGGEIHCGTNARRTPIDTWWTAALHLLGE